MSIGKLLFIIYHLPLFFSHASAQNEDRLFAVSDVPILAPAIEENDVGKRALRTLLEYSTDMERNMTLVPALPGDYVDSKIDVPFAFAKSLGWPPMNKTERLYKPPNEQVQPEKSKRFEKSERLVFNALVDLGKALDSPQTEKRVSEVLNWKIVAHADKKDYITESKTHRCNLRLFLAHRVNKTWSVRALVTNDRPDVWLAEYERLYLSENLMITNGTVAVQPVFFNLSIRPNVTRKYWDERRFNRNSLTRLTSTLAVWGGRAGVDPYGQHPIEENIALVAALQSSKDLTRQVLDSRTGSEIAILAFPLFMAAVPVSLFADVSDAMLLGYTVFTDVLSVLPLGIKGVEILKAGTDSYFSTRTLVFGNLESSTTVSAATWSCRCVSNQVLVPYGACFVAAALIAMIGGVFLEFFVRAQVKRNNDARELRLAIANIGAEVLWERRIDCRTCKCSESLHSSRQSLSVGLLGQIRQRRMEEKGVAEAYAAFRVGG